MEYIYGGVVIFLPQHQGFQQKGKILSQKFCIFLKKKIFRDLFSLFSHFNCLRRMQKILQNFASINFNSTLLRQRNLFKSHSIVRGWGLPHLALYRFRNTPRPFRATLATRKRLKDVLAMSSITNAMSMDIIFQGLYDVILINLFLTWSMFMFHASIFPVILPKHLEI